MLLVLQFQIARAGESCTAVETAEIGRLYDTRAYIPGKVEMTTYWLGNAFVLTEIMGKQNGAASVLVSIERDPIRQSTERLSTACLILATVGNLSWPPDHAGIVRSAFWKPQSFPCVYRTCSPSLE